MKIFKNILIITSLLYSFISYSSIYETCDWTNRQLTSKILENTNSLTPICDHHSSSDICIKPSQTEDAHTISVSENIKNHFEGLRFSVFYSIEDICFLASSIKGKNIFKARGSEYSCVDNRTSRNQRFYYCNDWNKLNSCQTFMPVTDSDGNKRHIPPQAPCLSENYIQTLSAGFNDMGFCFNLSGKELRDLFAIIHHESSFMSNSRSPTGAKCAGQLTAQALVNLNMDILLEKEPVHSIYMQAIKKCPYLQDILIPTDLLFNENYQNRSYMSLHRELDNIDFTCPLVSSMSRCFFYSFLFHKTSIELIERNISRLSNFLTSEDLDSFKSFISYLVYRGGYSVARTQLGRFIDQQDCKNEGECFSDIGDLKSKFTNHLRTTKNGKRLYSRETVNYPYAVQRDLDYFQSDFFIQHLLNFTTDLMITEEEIMNFSLEVREFCQFNQ